MSDLKVDGIIASTGTNTALTLQGKGTGTVDIGDGASSFPDADGSADQVIKTDGSGTLAFVTLASAGWTLESEVATTSGDDITVASGLSSPTEVFIAFHGLSQSNTETLDIVLGDSGGFETSAYISTAGMITVTTVSVEQGTDCIQVNQNNDAGGTTEGLVYGALIDATNNTWAFSHSIGASNDQVFFGGGTKSLSSTLTQIRLSSGASATFDAGSCTVGTR